MLADVASGPEATERPASIHTIAATAVATKRLALRIAVPSILGLL